MSDATVIRCSYCLAHSATTTAVMGFEMPVPGGDVPVALCQRHLDQLVSELTQAQRSLGQRKLVTLPKRNLRVVSPC